MKHEVIIVGGSYAGLAAALQLGRARRDVLIVDAGQRRNRFVNHSHGFLGQDGKSPAAIAAHGKSEVLEYPSVHWLDAAVQSARAVANGFALNAAGNEYIAERIILATGVVDDIPPIPGIAERWGKTVFHCPYCDGYELGRGKLGVLAAGPLAAHYASVVADWSLPAGTTLFLAAGGTLGDEEAAALTSRQIHVERAPIVEATDAPAGMALRVASGQRYEVAALFTLPNTRLVGGFAEQLGCEVESIPTGAIYKTDARTKETSVPGVFACGDAALAQNSVSFAVADGVRAGVAAHQSLIFGLQGLPRA